MSSGDPFPHYSIKNYSKKTGVDSKCCTNEPVFGSCVQKRLMQGKEAIISLKNHLKTNKHIKPFEK